MSSPSPGHGGASGLGPGIPPFVGRTQELDSLERCFRGAVAGRPRVVLVEGEAGIGKTRLLQEAMSVARRLGMEVWFGRCYEDLTLPYLPFVSVFGFVPLPLPLMLTMIGLTALYVLATELAKKYFYSRGNNAIA